MAGFKVYYGGDDKESSDEDVGLGYFSDNANDKESSDEDMGLGYFSDNAYRRESKETDHGDEQKVLPHNRVPPFVKEKVGFKVYYSREDKESSDEDIGYFSDNAYRQEIKETDNGDEQKVLPHHRIPPFVKGKVGFKVYYSREDKESSDEDVGYFSDNAYRQEIKETDNGDEHKVLPHHRIPPFVEEKVGLKVCFGGKESTDEEDIRYSNEDA